MKLYYSKGACSLAVRIALYEMDIPCIFEAVNLKTKVTETGSDFLTINPKGAVPVLVLDNQDILTENAVIQQYLGDTYQKTDLLPPIGTIQRYHVLEWLNFISTDLHKGAGPLFNPTLSEAVKDDIFRPQIKAKLTILNKRLEKNPFLMGDHFTLPDGYLFVILRWLPGFKMDIAEHSFLSRYFNELLQRKSIVKALQDEGISVV